MKRKLVVLGLLLSSFYASAYEKNEVKTWSDVKDNIDFIDREILDLIFYRQEIIKEGLALKNVKPEDKDSKEYYLEKMRTAGVEEEMNLDLVVPIYKAITETFSKNKLNQFK